MTTEQRLHNARVEMDIMFAEMEHEQYLKRCKAENEAFRLTHPDLPEEILQTVCMPVIGKRCIVAIKYVD